MPDSAKQEQQGRPVFIPTQCRDVRSKPGVEVKSVEATTDVKKSVPSSKAATKLSDVQKPSVYSPAYVSSTLPGQSPPGNTAQVILPVEDIQSPSNLSVRLVSEEAALLQVVEEMNEKPPPVVKGWTVGKRETVAVYWDNVWYRGLAVKKTEGKFSIYLLDFRSVVTVAPDMLRPLPAKQGTIPAAAYQVCLAGVGPLQGDVWGEEIGGIFGEIINSDTEYKLGVEFLGQVEGGRWLVKMKGVEDDEDIAQMLIAGELGKTRVDSMSGIKSQDNKSTMPALSPNIPAVASSATVKDPNKHVKDDVIDVLGPRISRGVITVNTSVGVCFLETPVKLFVCPSSCLSKFMEILTSAQEAPAGSVNPISGSCCLAMDEDCWYRGEVVKVGKDEVTATIFLLDYGKTVKVPVSSLRPLPEGLADTPGLVCQVSLGGIGPSGKDWSEQEVTGAFLVMDVGGETQFIVTDVNVDDKKTVVRMKDVDGNDVSDLMVETGLAQRVNIKDDLSLIPGTLSAGQHKLLVLAAISPMELHLCSQEQFQYFSDTIVPCVEKVAAKADKVVTVKEGDLVLACEDQVWYRAVIKQSLSEVEVMVELVDLALVTKVNKENIRAVNASVLKDPVVAVTCCLDSWAEEDKKVALEKWGDKMESILEQYSEIEVEVVGLVGNQVRVKAPSVEQKFSIKEVSRADMLKMKLKQKK